MMLKKYSKAGKGNDLVIFAFPTNDFRQEPGSNNEIKAKVIKLLGQDLFDQVAVQSSVRSSP